MVHSAVCLQHPGYGRAAVEVHEIVPHFAAAHLALHSLCIDPIHHSTSQLPGSPGQLVGGRGRARQPEMDGASVMSRHT
jgi:hypothetical protein